MVFVFVGKYNRIHFLDAVTEHLLTEIRPCVNDYRAAFIFQVD
jgi:hypothetical protein